jgi:hypothetical protein
VPEHRRGGLEIVGMNGLHPAGAESLVRRQAGHRRPSCAHAEDIAGAVGHPGLLRAEFDDVAVVLFRLPRLRFGLAQVSDVEAGAAHGDHRFVLDDRTQLRPADPWLAIGANNAELVLAGLPVREDVTQLRQRPAAILRVDDRKRAAEAEPGRGVRQAEHPQELVRESNVASAHGPIPQAGIDDRLEIVQVCDEGRH